MPIGTNPRTTQDILNLVAGAATGSGTVHYLQARPLTVTYLLLDSFTTANGSATGTAAVGLAPYRDADVLVDVTVASGTAATLDVYLDSRLDGTGWSNLGRLTAITGTAKALIHLSKRQAAVEIAGGVSDAGAGTVRAIGWGDDLRVRRNITGTTPSFSARVWLNLFG
ncbi:MAG: hypothetical protein Q8O40_16315 [Chloroflexota bacterium]|nr:hypothetical protein [Chloroflexota bacterium]